MATNSQDFASNWLTENCSVMFEYIPEAIHVLDSFGNLLVANPAFCRFLGYDPAVNAPVNVDAWDTQWSVEKITALLAEPPGASFTYQTRYRLMNGDLQSVEVQAVTLPAGTVGSLLCTVRNVNKEDELGPYNQIVNQMAEGVVLIRSTDSTIVYVNEKFEHMFGYQPGELAGNPVTILNASTSKDPQEVADEIEQTLLVKGKWSGEIENLRKDGRHFWCHAVVSTFEHPRFGKVWVAVHDDITERRVLAEALQTQEMLFREILEHSLDVSYRRNLLTDRYDYLSPVFSELTGFPTDEFSVIPLKNVLGFIHPDDRTQVQQDLATATSDTGEPHQLEYRFKHHNGNYIWCQDRFRVQMDPQGVPVSIVGSLREITLQKQAQEALWRSESFLNTIIENSPFSMWISDETGTLIRANQALRTLLKVSDDEIVGKYNVLTDNIVFEQGLLPQVQAVFEQGLPAHFTIKYDTSQLATLQLAHFSQMILEVTIFPVVNAEGNFSNAIIQHVDITERVRAEQALIENQELYRQLFETNLDAVFLTAPDGSVQAANPAASRMFGWTEAELCQGGRDLIIDRADPALLQALRERTRSGQFRGELNYRRKDGTTFPGEVSSVQYTHQNGSLHSTVMVRDISERKQLEHELQEKTAFLTQVIDHIGQGLTVSDPDGYLELVNPAYARLLDRAPEDLIGKHPREFTHTDDHTVLNQAWESRKLGEASTYETHLVRADGSQVPVLITGVPRLKDGQPAGAIAVITDLSQLKDAELALRQNEEKYRGFVSQSTEAFALTDEGGVIIEWNETAEKFTGISAGEALGRYTWDVQQLMLPLEMRTADRLEASRQSLQLLLQQGGNPSMGKYFEIELVKSRGERHFLRQMFFVIQTTKGYRIGSITRDVTDEKLAEQKLRESEERFAGIFNASPVGITIINLVDGRCLHANAAFSRVVDLNHEQIVGHIWQELNLSIEMADLERIEKMLTAPDHTGPLDVRIRTGSGQIKDLLLSAMLINLDGENCAMLTGQDVTELKRAEALVREYALFPRLNPGLVFRIDVSGSVLLVNPTAASFGIQAGLAIRSIFPEIQLLDLLNCIQNRGSLNYEFRLRDRTFQITIQGVPDLSQAFVYGVDVSERKQVETSLLESEEKLRAIIDTSPDAIGLFDANAHILMMNPAAATTFGYKTSAEMTGKSALEFFLPEEREKAMEVIQQIFASGTVKNVEFKLLKKDGDWFNAEFSCSALYGEAGIPKGIIAVTRDITERKQAEEALRESEARFATVFHASPENIVITRFSDGCIVDANESFCAQMGLPHEEIIGKTSLEANFWANPEDRDQLMSLVREKGQSLGFEMQFRAASGKIGISLLSTVVVTLAGEAHLLIMSLDITERKRAEEALLESEREYRHLLNLLPSGIVVHSEGQIILINEASARLFGAEDPQKLIGSALIDRVHPDYRNLVHRRIDQSHQKEISAPLIQEKLLRLDGSVFDAEVAAMSILYQGKSSVLALFNDITDRKRAEAEIATLALRNQTLLNTSKEGIHVLDDHGRVIEANPAFCSMLGYSHEEILQLNVADWDMQWAGEELLAKVHELMASPAMFETRQRRKDGTLIEVEINGVGIILDGHNYLYAAARDITERKHSEEALKKSETRFRAIIDVSPVPMALNDEEQNITYLNPAFVQTFGYALEDVPTLGDWWRKAYPDLEYRRWVSTAWQTKLEQTKHNGTEFSPMEVVISCKNGMSKTVLASATSITNLFERNHLVMLYDISERKQMEEALRVSEQQYHDMFDVNTAVKLLVDPVSGEIIKANQAAAEFYGWSIAQLETMNINQINTLSDDQIKAEMDLAIRQMRTYFNFQNRLASGDLRDVEIYTSPVEIDGRVLLYSIMHDVSDRKKAEAALLAAQAELEQRVLERTADLQTANIALEKASHAKDEFLAIMSHELRTPLTGILGLAQVMQFSSYGQLNEKQMTAIQNIEQSGQHLLELINEILDFSKLQSGKFELQRSVCILDSICKAALQMLNPLAAQKNIVLVFNVSPTMLVLQADERRIRQVIINLLSNAIKFTPEGGSVELAVQGIAEVQQVRISVIDTGIGIKAEDLPRLFQPFAQLDTRLSRMYGGTGLGLALVKNLVELHGGSVKVESVFGQGSCFTVSLPWLNQ
jgi:PAS domain S-box-containing protein